MMRDINRRIAAIEAAAKLAEQRRRLHDPFVHLIPWGFLNDVFYLEYFPEGLFQEPEKSGPISFDEVVSRFKELPRHLSCHISLGKCTEWLFAFYNFGSGAEVYTDEQIDRAIQSDLKCAPELGTLLVDENLLETILKIPQNFTVSVGVLLDATEESNEKNIRI